MAQGGKFGDQGGQLGAQRSQLGAQESQLRVQECRFGAQGGQFAALGGQFWVQGGLCTKMSHFFTTHTIFPPSSLTKRRCLLLLLSHRKCLTKIMCTAEVVNKCGNFISQTRIFHVAG